MKDTNLVGFSPTNSMTIPADKLSAPGVPSRLIVAAQFKDDRYAGKDRFEDSTLRPFEVTARLSKQPKDPNDMRADFQPEHGASFFRMPTGKSHMEMGIGNVALRLDANQADELSIVSSKVEATKAIEARLAFENALAICLDHLSYRHGVPAFVALLAVRDVKNEVAYIYFVSPPRSVTLIDSEHALSSELIPVYALYRESQNSTSAYYRVLCLYKIMEGLLGPLQAAVHQTAKLNNLSIQAPKALVPDHTNIAPWLREHVGKSMKSFFDNVLAKQYRDAIAHFELKSKAALIVSSPPDTELFAHAAFLADLCVRVLIARHEQSLSQLASAQTSGT